MNIKKPIFPRFGVWAAMALALVAAGCKSSGKNDATPLTASGHPEIVLRAETISEVMQAIREFFLHRGYVERGSRATNELMFDKPTKSGRSSKAYRVILRLRKETNESWRLVGIPMGVDGWRSDLESETAVPQGASQIQAFLEEIKNSVESER
jgi:hypothetical protein